MIDTRKILCILVVALFTKATFAHPGEDTAKEIAELQARPPVVRSLDHCASQIASRAVQGAKRRSDKAEKLRSERGIHKEALYITARDIAGVQARDLATNLNTDHNKTGQGITQNTSFDKLFNSSASCAMTPYETEGPYYVTGELIRDDVREDQEGVDIVLELEFINIETCEPLYDIAVDWWSCNATGAYSGVNVSDFGISLHTLDQTFMRGVQMTDTNGIVQFTSKFPEHYATRATHVHILTSVNYTMRTNGTISGGTVPMITQLYFDQDLRDEVEKLPPYNTNTVAETPNKDDFYFELVANSTDPVLNYVYLGNSLSDGIFGWYSFGVNLSEAYDPAVRATWTADGGVENLNNDYFVTAVNPNQPTTGASSATASSTSVANTTSGA